MKTNAIVRIVIFSILIFVLLGVLLAGMGIGMFLFTTGGGTGEMNTVTQISQVCLDPSSVENIHIQWVAGSVVLRTADVEEITFGESGQPDATPMVWQQNGNTLTIHYRKPGFRFGFFSEPEKHLVIYVPQDWDCRELDVETVSGYVELDGLAGQELEIESVSGICNLKDCYVDDVSISTVSGDITYEGTLDTFACDAVSARCDLQLRASARQIELDGVSGNLVLYLPAHCGFTADFDSASGDFSSDFDFSLRSGRYEYGDGSCHIDVSTVSGDVKINKKP